MTRRKRTLPLGPFLETVYARYARPELLSSDPLGRVVAFEAPEDREIAGFIAAGLSFGNVVSIQRSIDRALGPLGPRPATTLREASVAERHGWSRGFNHRWIFEDDLANVYAMLGAALRQTGGLEPLFAAGMSADAPDVRSGAASLVAGLSAHLPAAALARRGTRSFLPDALGPSATKRLHMFLRWMVRTGDVDLGLWTSARPDQLLIPLDTHVARISRYIGLTARATAGRATVLEITERLRKIDPADPVRFDFALSRLGILGDCPTRRDPVCCEHCPLFDVCRL